MEVPYTYNGNKLSHWKPNLKADNTSVVDIQLLMRVFSIATPSYLYWCARQLIARCICMYVPFPCFSGMLVRGQSKIGFIIHIHYMI